MTAQPVGSDHSEESRRVVVPLPFGLCAIYILKEKPKQPCREREPEPVLPWPPEDWEPAPW
jgi:hypothetical protein